MHTHSEQQSVSFATLLQQHHGDIFSYLFSLVFNQADAEDLYQETAVILWEKFDEFEPGTDFRRWATRIAHLKAMNFIRRNRRRQSLFSEDAIRMIVDAHHRSAANPPEDRIGALMQCLGRLSSGDHRLIECRYAGQKSVDEIAVAEDRSSDAIYKSLRRIRQSLLTCIEQRMRAEASS